MTDHLKLRLKDVRVSWVSGKLHKNGKEVTEEQVSRSIFNKYLAWYGEKPDMATINRIIFNDPSRYKQHLSDVDRAQIAHRKLELQMKTVDLKRLKEEYRLNDQAKKLQENSTDLKSRELIETSVPEDFGLSSFQRLPLPLVVLAIQSVYPQFTDKQCKIIVGGWVRRNL